MPDEDARASATLPITASRSVLDREGLDLTDKQRAFAEAYVLNAGNASGAARAAGYAPSSSHAIGHRNLSIPEVQRAIYVLSTAALGSAIPGALSTVRKLSTSAKSEYVRLTASQDVLNRVGMTAPKRVDVNGTV